MIVQGRTNMGFTGWQNTPERREQVTIVDYLVTGVQFMIPASEAKSITSTGDLCGKTVVSLSGSPYPGYAADVSATDCEARGQNRIDIIEVTDLSSALVQIKQGRADAALWGPEYIAYMMELQQGQWATLGDIFEQRTYGAFVSKADEALALVIQEGLNAMIADGTYQKILDKWNLSGSAVESATINGTAS